MAYHPLGPIDALPPGSSRIVEIAGREIGVFNVGGRVRALRNLCPHQGGPLCLGTVDGTTMPAGPGNYVWGRDGEILRCPWHGWEFDLLTGRALFDSRVKVRTYPCEVRDGEVFLIL